MAEKIASITAIPVVYEKGTTGNYILDSRGEKKIIKIGNRVQKTDDWEGIVTSEFSNNPLVDIITNLAEPIIPKTFLDIIVPELQKNRIEAGLVLYENWADLPSIYPGHPNGVSFDAALFKSNLQTELNKWSGVTNYQTFFNSYPHDIEIAYEGYITAKLNGDGVTVPGITGANVLTGLTLLNLTSLAAREVSPSSRVYQYNAPGLPYNMPAPVLGSDWYQRSNYPYTALGATGDRDYANYKILSLQRFSDKVNLIKDDADIINIEVYPKHFAGYTYPSPPDYTGYPDQFALKANGTKEYTYASIKGAHDNIPNSKKVQLQTSPVVYNGSGYLISQLNTVQSVQDLSSLIWSNEMLSNYVMKPAKDAGARSMFIWHPWYQDSGYAARPLTGITGPDNDNLTLVTRKMINDLFTDTGYTGTIGLTNDSSWAATSTRIYAITAATQKTVAMANLFRQL
jgi:hypothetical protein